MRKPSVPCSDCGKLMWPNKPGISKYGHPPRCMPCKRARPTVPKPHPCELCGAIIKDPRPRRRFCSMACYGKNNQVRADSDHRVERGQREHNAPGLVRTKRVALLAKWKKQGRTCVYCTNPADTIDHVVSLVHGGTNYEGNLVPCCRSCNSSKQSRTIMEWRLGKRPTRRATVLPTKARAPRIVKVKIKPTRPTLECTICGAPTPNLTCGLICSRERSSRQIRNYYRAAHGLPLDMDKPVRQRKAV